MLPIPTFFQWDFSHSFRMGSLLFLRNSLPVQSCISFASATFSVKQTLRAAPAGWKCPPLTCTALAQCSGQVWNYALVNKWHPTHSYWSHEPTNSLQNKCQTADPDRQNLGRPCKLSFIIKFWQNCASVRQVSDLILKTEPIMQWGIRQSQSIFRPTNRIWWLHKYTLVE